MDTLTFISVLAVCSLLLGITGLFGKKADAYSIPFFSGRLLFMGILLSVILFVSFFKDISVETSDYLISYIFLLFGIVSLFLGITIAISDKANNYWWRLVKRIEEKNDRKGLIGLLLILSFGFFFAFFLFYPPFITIG